MNALSSPSSFDGGHAHYMRRERFEINQYVRVQVSENRYAIGVVTAINEEQDKATVETRHGYEVTLPIAALRRAFLLVLDLNGVLVARGRGSFILRPHVQEFLKFVFSNFVVAVWTSGLQRSSNPIIEHVFGNYKDLLLFMLFRDACVPKASAENPYGTEKNLQVIFDRYPQSFHAVNTIIIDDSPDKCSHPDIALCPIPFKDPVAQSQDTGLLETMETLRQVLLLDSGAPLIYAAEARRQRLAENSPPKAADSPAQSLTDPPYAAPDDASTTTPTPSSAIGTTSHASPSSPAIPLAESARRESPTDMEEVELWKTRLCCDNLRGKCNRGDKCPFSHDLDDGRPCSAKSHCKFHGNRWPKTYEEAQWEAHKRQIREAKKQQYRTEQEHRQLQSQHQQQQHSSYRTSKQRGQQPQHANAPPRQRGGRQRPARSSHRPHDDESIGGIEDEDWAAGPTGLSHTGDPAYDNMINEQQLQQLRRGRGAAGAGTISNVAAAALPNHPPTQQQHHSNASSGAPRGCGSDLSHAHHRHSCSSRDEETFGAEEVARHAAASATANRGSRPPHRFTSQQQQQQQHHASQGSAGPSSASALFRNADAASTVTPAKPLEPFSTRPIVPTFSTAAQPTHPQQQQTIRISGRQGDTNAVVSQLQALMQQN